MEPAIASGSTHADPGTRAEPADPGTAVHRASVLSTATGLSTATMARLTRRPRDMVIAMAVLLLPVAVLLGLYVVIFNGAAPVAVDPSSALDSARHAGAFTVLTPTGLPPGWTISSAAAGPVPDGYTLRLGYLTPGQAGLQLVESSQPPDELLPAELGAGARPADLVVIDGQQWRPYPVTGAGERALVLSTDRGTVLIVGTAAEADLVTLAASLR